MINTYLTDIISLVRPALDEWSVLTETIVTGIHARVEDENRQITDNNGKEVFSQGYIIADNTADIKYDDLIMIESINGVATENPGKRLGIKKLSRAHGFQNSHWEIWI